MKKSKLNKFKLYRKILLGLSGIAFLGMLLLGYFTIKNSIPDEITITEENREELDTVFANPILTWDESIPVSQGKQYSITCKILKTIFLKNVTVQMVRPQWVQVSGNAVGIYMATKGILIVDTEEIKGQDGLYHNPAENLVQPGDYITKFNQNPISSKEDLVECVKHCEGGKISLSLIRNEKEIQLAFYPVKCQDENYKLGIWVRDDTQGIGTLTYVDGQNRFGALGHGISDMDLGNLLEIQNGTLYTTEIMGIHKGEKGAPGELAGLIRYQKSEEIGNITRNTENGIFGKIDVSKKLSLNNMPVGYKQEVKRGAASILCTLNESVSEYEVMITKIDYNHQDTNKSIVIEVTDSELLNQTGGIVQGMSGAPILQNGKVIGAVTHVFVNDPTKGYGIFIETMLEH